MKTTVCILLLAAAAWTQEVAVPQGGSLGPSCKLSDAATLGADKLDGSHSSPTAAANTVPVADSNGKLAPGWIPLPTGSSIGGIFMSADCLAGNHVSGIDPATGQLKCAADTADWSNIGNKPSAFPPDTGSQSWQDLLGALALKAPLANAALTGTTTAEQIVAATSVQVGSGTAAVNFSYGTAAPTGACSAGMYWRQVSADTVAEFYCNAGSWAASGAGGGATWGSIAGTLASQTDLQNALNARVLSADKGANNGVASLNASAKVVQDPANAQTSAASGKIPLGDVSGKLSSTWLPLPSTSSLGGVFISSNCGAGNHVNGINLTTGELTCSADTGGSPSSNATSLQGRTLDSTAPSSNQFLAWLGSSWGPSNISSTQVSGLGNAATKNTGTAAGTVAAGDDSRITGALPKSGGTMTGTLTLAGDPSGTNDAANKAYVDTHTLASVSEPSTGGDSGKVVSTKPVKVTGGVESVASTDQSVDLPAVTSEAVSASGHVKFISKSNTAMVSENGGAYVALMKNVPPGSNQQVLYNDNGAWGYLSGFTFDKSTGNFATPGQVSVGGTSQMGNITEATCTNAVSGKGKVMFNSSTHRPCYGYDGSTLTPSDVVLQADTSAAGGPSAANKIAKLDASGLLDDGMLPTVPLANLPASLLVRQAQVVIFGSGAAGVLQDTDDVLSAWSNNYGATWKVSAVSVCRDGAGGTNPTVMVSKANGGANLLTGNITVSGTCSTDTYSAGTLVADSGANRTVADGAGVDVKVVAAGGTATEIHVKLVGSLQ